MLFLFLSRIPYFVFSIFFFLVEIVRFKHAKRPNVEGEHTQSAEKAAKAI